MSEETAGLTAADIRVIEDDEVVRLGRFRAAHPGVAVTAPSENGTVEFRATWTDGDGVVHDLACWDLRRLLAALERAFGGEAP